MKPDHPALARWVGETLGANKVELGPLLGGGNANVTRLIFVDGKPLVLRHPPSETVSDRAAAGVEREYRLLSAIANLAPVPQPHAFCNDSSVLGAPFMIVEHIDGVAISETLPTAYPDTAATVTKIGEALIDALGAVHSIDWQGRLPAEFGRPEGFVKRQIGRWLEVRARERVRDLPLLDELGQWLLENLPEPPPARIIHCDYHLDNTLFARSGPELKAIIDWEMASVGDPLLDLGLLLMFWGRNEASPLGFRFVQRVSNRPGVIDARALADRWTARTGICSATLDYYRCLAFWRLAAIVEGAFVLQRRGRVDSTYARNLEHDVPNLLAEAATLAG